MRLKVLLAAVALAGAACGVKAPPRPPLPERAVQPVKVTPPAPAPASTADAGCCDDAP